ncbi:NADPH-dependent FMN reductase [Psychroflexus aestuariivivens]|uniref:NADPH-dependent FMN reductase n=1 Tax=Psychroflexus aestuariivivens TaxID=1795040 RepID=UPI000FDBB0CA|nr:NAD(P)H-dependent oxidoreductase [Psychroflexus aestuariivivens]
MTKILAFTGSNSSKSINEKLLKYTIELLIDVDVDVDYSNLNTLELPIYSEDEEENKGIPIDIRILSEQIQKYDALVVSVNEHNGAMSAFFKNITDWLSRNNSKYLEGKNIFLMSASPGKGGAKSSLEYTKSNFEKFGGKIVESFSFPLFHENFDVENNKINSEDLELGLRDVVSNFLQNILED